jgi:cytochrome P450
LISYAELARAAFPALYPEQVRELLACCIYRDPSMPPVVPPPHVDHVRDAVEELFRLYKRKPGGVPADIAARLAARMTMLAAADAGGVPLNEAAVAAAAAAQVAALPQNGLRQLEPEAFAVLFRPFYEFLA